MSDSSTGFAQEAGKSEVATTEVSYEALAIGMQHTPGGQGAGPRAGPRREGGRIPAFPRFPLGEI